MDLPTRSPLARRLARSVAVAVTAAALVSVCGCASKPKTAGRIYAGEAPSMKYHNRETAGGPIGGW